MNLSVSHIVFAVGITIYLMIRGFFQLKTASTRKTVSRASLFDWSLVAAITIAQVVLPTICVWTPWLNSTNHSLPGWCLPVGAIILLIGLWLFWRSHVDLGECWSVTLKLNEKHQLITTGVYKNIRHPMYLAFFLLAVGQGLLIHNWLAGWSALLATSVLCWFRLPHEERLMLDFFDDQYVCYQRKTSLLIPSLSRRSQTSEDL